MHGRRIAQFIPAELSGKLERPALIYHFDDCSPGKSGKEIFRFQECSGSIFLELFACLSGRQAYFLFQDKKQDEEIIENSFNQTVRKGMPG